MKTLHKTILMALFASLIMISPVSGQPTKGVVPCATMASNCTGPDGMKTCTLQRNFGSGATMYPSCVTTVEVNANCSIMVTSYFQTFNAVQTGPSPSCQWSCSACATVTINTSTGLPVELLGFEIEGDDATAEPPPSDDDAPSGK